MIKNIVTATVVSAVIALGALTVLAPDVQPVKETIVGAISSPDVHSYMNVDGPFAYGKPCFATSTSAAGTLQSDDVDDGQCVTVDILGAATTDITLTLAASTTQFCPMQEGAVKRWFIQNATTSATADVTIAGGTGVTLKQATTSGVLIPGDTDGENFAVIDVKRNADTDCTAFINVYKD